MATSHSLSMSVTLNAKPAEVFRALTDSKTIQAWSGQKGTVEARIGGKFEMFDGWARGNVLAYQSGKTLSHTWHISDWDETVKPSIVKYTFTPVKSGTKILLKHSGLPSESSRKEHRGGWIDFVFDPLKEYFGSE